eukprot:g21004.t1
MNGMHKHKPSLCIWSVGDNVGFNLKMPSFGSNVRVCLKRIRDAYLTLTSKLNPLEVTTCRGLPEAPQNDFQLRNHQALVRELFEKETLGITAAGDGVDLDQSLRRQAQALDELGLRAKNLGAVNQNERGEEDGQGLGKCFCA